MVRLAKKYLAMTCCFAALLIGSQAVGQSEASINETFDKPFVTAEMITLPTKGNYESFMLTIIGPDKFHYEMEFSGQNVPFIDTFGPNGDLLPDGSYAFELKKNPTLSEDARDALAFARATGDTSETALMRKTGEIPTKTEPLFGYFRIHQGQFVIPGAVEELYAAKGDGRDGSEKPGDPVNNDEVIETPTGDDDSDLGDRAQVIPQDLVVQGSICVGFDCVNGESFGFDTLRLKENNLRIHFQDTSVSASFPTNDWRILANDTSNGGKNFFAVEDSDAGRRPFTIEASAPSNSIYLEDGGRVGFGTATPVANLHVAEGNTPTLRLEQDGSQGFTPQTWDLAGNEANFFLRDATNGSKLSIQVKPSAPTASLFIAADGDVGLTTAAPDADLHVEGGPTGATALVTANGSGIPQFQALYEGTTAARREMFFLSNYGEPTFRFSNTDPSAADDWSMILLADDSFLISRNGSGAEEMRIFNGGNVTIGGDLTEPSDVNSKENFEEVDPIDVLNKVSDLPITTWNYIKDEDEVRHMGPMAQDFAAAFGLGRTNTGISGMDVRGVVLAAIQGLSQRIDEKDADLNEKDQTILALQKENASLSERLDNLESQEVDALKKRLATLEAMILKMNESSK